MSLEIRLPDLGEGIEDADVLKVLVSVGDEVQVDQPLLEIETDKATLDVPSSAAGRVTAVHVQPGATLAVGALIVTVEEAGAPSSAAPASSAPPEAAAEPEAPSTPTREEAPEPAPVVEAPSAAPADAPSRAAEPAMAAEAPAAHATAAPQDEAPRAATPTTAPEATEAPEATAPPSSVPVAPSVSDDGPPVFASPSVRRFAREIGIDLREVRGSGPGGRVSEDDVKRHARESRRGATSDGAASEGTAAPASSATPAPSSGAGGGARIEVPALPDFGAFGPVEREPLSRFRRTVARNMAVSWAEAPHVTLHRMVDVTELEALRQRFKQRASDAGGALTVTVILLKIVAAALKANPRFNATLDLEAGELILKHYYDIGVAVDTPRGLAVPVIRGVDEKNIIELSVELTKTAERARSGDLTVEEMRGGTFTLTNLGGMGIAEFSPIINWPEVAVLGVGRAEQQPVWIDGKWEPRLRMPLSLTHDHRIIDGADGARFLTWIDEAIAEPLLIALEG